MDSNMRPSPGGRSVFYAYSFPESRTSHHVVSPSVQLPSSEKCERRNNHRYGSTEPEHKRALRVARRTTAGLVGGPRGRRMVAARVGRGRVPRAVEANRVVL